MSKKIILGLDLGIASVGYSVLLKDNEDVSLLERGSHIFPILSNPKTITSPGGYGEGERGSFRRARRTIARRKYRRQDFINLINDRELKKSNFSHIFNFDANEIKKQPYPIYKLAVKGLKEELTPIELFKVLYSKLSFRGVSYSIPNEDMNKSVAEELLETFEKNGKIRSAAAKIISEKNDQKQENKETQKELTFSLKRNKKDLEKIIDNCSYLINTDFKEKYLEIFSRVRDYSKGAGSEKFRTNGGIYTNIPDGKGGLKTLKNMWETSIGKCPIYMDEQRSLRCQALPEIGNLLSQLNYMYFIDESDERKYLTLENKKAIIQSVMKDLRSVTLKRIENLLQLNKGSLRGYPKTKNKEEANFEKTENLISLFKKEVISYSDNWNQILDKIKEIDILFKDILIDFYNKDEVIYANKDFDLSIKKLKDEDKNNIIENYENFANLNPWSGKDIKEIDKKLENYQKTNLSGTHSISLSAYYDFITKNIDQQKSISTFYRKEFENQFAREYKFNEYSKYMNNRLMDNVEFISPNIKNSMSETIKIFNKILKKYVYNGPKYSLDAIVIENTSDNKYSLSSFDSKKKISAEQNANEKIRKDILKIPGAKEEHIEKIRLLREQDNRDPYDLQPIYEDDVINNPSKYEVDHILPFSRTRLNTLSNKVLTKSLNNQNKKGKTSFEWLNTKPNFKEIQAWWEETYKNNPEKLKYLKLDNLNGSKEFSFIMRNLTETQYIMRRIKRGFIEWQNFVKKSFIGQNQDEVKNIVNSFDVLNISGFATQKIRNDYLKNEKNRDESQEHHSVDATICAFLGTIKEFRDTYQKFDWKIDKETGEIIRNYKINSKNIFNEKNVSTEKWENLKQIIESSKWTLSYKYLTKLDKFKTLDKKLEEAWSWTPKKIANETQLGWIEINNEKKQKKRINLLDSENNKLSDNDIKYLNIAFNTPYNESKCLNAKNYFDALAKIWNANYSKESNQNPFEIYMNKHIDDFEDFKNSYLQGKVKVIDDKLKFDISRLTFIGDKASIGLSSKSSNNGYFEGLGLKLIYIIEDLKTGKIKFEKEDWTNKTIRGIKDKPKEEWLNKIIKKNDQIKYQIIDILEPGMIFELDDDLYRISGFNINESSPRIVLSSINRKHEFKMPYSTWLNKNKKLSNARQIK